MGYAGPGGATRKNPTPEKPPPGGASCFSQGYVNVVRPATEAAGSTGQAAGLRTRSRGVYAHGADDQPDVDVALCFPQG